MPNSLRRRSTCARGQARVARTCRAAADEAEVALRAAAGQRSTRPLAHALDAVAHFGQFRFPLRAQFRRGQHGGDDLAAVRRRVRVVGADHALELRQHARGFFLRLA